MNIHQSSRVVAFGAVVIGVGLLAVVTTSVGSATSPTTAARGTSAATWAEHAAVVDASITRRDVSSAVRAWHDAYGAALVTGSWRPVLEVGDSMLRIGEISGSANGAKANARQAYMSALRRAERARDAEGVLRTAEAFARLGDRAVAGHCLVLAGRIARATGDTETLDRVRAAAPDSTRVTAVDSDLFIEPGRERATRYRNDAE